MKRILLIMLMVITSAFIYAKPNPAGVGISFGYFYSSLSPHGEWIEIDADVFAWRPHSVGWNWRPYSVGRWAWTRHGWYWDSYEPFGWATYHYGRWFYDDYYGWIWIPDYEWGPSWVEWRYDDDYIGWAPLPPYASFRVNFGIHFSIGWTSHYSYWNFVPYNRFCDYRVNHYIIDSRRSHRIFERTKYRTNYYRDRDYIVNGGVDRSFIERKAGYRITERDIRNTDNYNQYERTRRSRNDGIYDYRPSERDANRNVERYNIKRGEKRTSLDRDKIVISHDRNSEEIRSRNDAPSQRNRIESKPESRPEVNRNRIESNTNNREMKEPESRVRNNESRKESDANRSNEIFKSEKKTESRNESNINRDKSNRQESAKPKASESRERRSESKSRNSQRSR